MVLVGIGGILLTNFVPLLPDKKTLNIASAALLCFGMFGQGMIAERSVWETKVHEMEVKILELEKESKEVTIKTITKYIDRIKIITEKGDDIETKVTIYVPKDTDDNCVVNNGFVMLHDESAETGVSNTTGIINETSGEIAFIKADSGIKLSQVAKTVNDNYTQYHLLAEQLKSLQEWINKQHKLSKDFNKEIK